HSRVTAPGAAPGSPRGACVAADRGTAAATTRYPKDRGLNGYSKADPAVHLQLFAADAVGGVGQAGAPEVRGHAADGAARGAGACETGRRGRAEARSARGR